MKTILLIILMLFISCESRTMDDIKKEMEIAQKNQDVEKQLNLYDEIINEFQGSKEAITAEFQIAFIYNNYLENYDEAEKRYKAFIEKYPDHELVTSAKYEIETLRIPADQLLLPDSLSNEVITK